MPNRQPVTETAAVRALDQAVREYDETEALFKAKDAALRTAIVEAAREAATDGSDLTMQAIADRVGWTRETINRIATAAGVTQPRRGRRRKRAE